MLTLSPASGGVRVYAVDPDLHFSSLVGLGASGEIIALGQTDVDSNFKGSSAAVALWKALRQDLAEDMERPAPGGYLLLEDQEARMGGKNARSLILLSRAAGLAHAAAAELFRPDEVRYVPPSTWIGSVPKRINQERIVRRSGLPATKRGTQLRVEWPQPHDWASRLSAGRQGHLIDALGLALWGKSNLERYGRVLPLEFLG